MALTKPLTLDDDVRDVLHRSRILRPDTASEWLLKLPGQLERSLYERVMKVLATEGGKWSQTVEAHVFTHDPTEALVGAAAAGELTTIKEGWFPTPRLIVEQMLQLAPWENGEILELSSGEGAIAEGIIRRWPEAELYLLCIERNAQRASTLQTKGLATLQADFLTLPLPARFERIYLNPPFEQGQDIDHVLRAYSLLAIGGVLVAVMSEGPFFRQDQKSIRFREHLAAIGGDTVTLPEDSFRESGTGVRVRLVHIRKET